MARKIYCKGFCGNYKYTTDSSECSYDCGCTYDEEESQKNDDRDPADGWEGQSSDFANTDSD